MSHSINIYLSEYEEKSAIFHGNIQGVKTFIYCLSLQRYVDSNICKNTIIWSIRLPMDVSFWWIELRLSQFIDCFTFMNQQATSWFVLA